MKLIKAITDRNILGTEGLSTAPPRYTARAIVRRKDGLYAVMYAEKFGLYSLPGGGIEPGESRIDALKREILEETGCECAEIREIGCVYENRCHCDYTQYSYYYYVETDGPTHRTELTENEKRNRTGVQWLGMEDVYLRITSAVHTTNQRRFIQAKDTAALDAFRKNGLFEPNC